MKRMAKLGAGAAAVSLAIALAAGTSGATSTEEPRHADSGRHVHAIVGTWQVEVRPEGSDETFQALVTASPGGGLVEIESTNPGTSLGAWKALGGNRVAATFQSFQFDAEGAPAGRAVVRTEVTVEDDEFSGPFAFEVFDTEGNVVASGEGVATARRFKVQRL